MTHAAKVLVIVGVFATSAAIAGEPDSSSYSLNGNADLCFGEAQKAAAGADAAELSTAPCRRALRHEPISRADRSAMLHNRGIIEQARGDLAAARASFAHAVRLSTTVDKRNLALAQVAHKRGELELAVEQYDLLIAAGIEQQDAATRKAVLANRRSAAEALGTVEVADNQ